MRSRYCFCRPFPLVVLVVFLVIGSALGASTAYAQAPTAQISPSSAGPGETVTLSGSGWPAGVAVGARMVEASDLTGPSAVFGTGAQTNAQGNFSFQATVPNTLFGPGARGNLIVIPGAYTVIVTGGGVSVNVPFTVTAPRGQTLLFGTMFLDLNGNGRLDPGDLLPFAGVTVADKTTGRVIARAMTDIRGHYLVSVAPGTYLITSQSEFMSERFAATATATVQPGQAVEANLVASSRGASIAHPERCFPQTGFCVEDDAFWNYFVRHGGVQTLGYPVSRTFELLDRETQFFQRFVLQKLPDGSVRQLDLLAPGFMPFDRINGATFPAFSPTIASAAPRPDTPDYGRAVLQYLQTSVPNRLDGQTVNFLQSYLAAASPSAAGFPPLVALDVWGFPTSQPTADPNNHAFMYQRFERGILHFQGLDVRGSPITGGILLADWFKSLITGRDLPPDLEAEAREIDSRFLRQYCPEQTNWICRPSQLPPGNDFRLAFERQR